MTTENPTKEKTAQRWQELLRVTGKSSTEIADIAGVNKSNITNYCKAKYKAKQDVIYKVCHHFKINEAWLMGFDVPMRKSLELFTVNYDELKFPRIPIELSEIYGRLPADGQLDLVEYAKYLLIKYSAKKENKDG